MGPVARLHNCCTRQLLVSSKSFSVEKTTISGTMDINKVKTTEVWALYNNIIIIFA